MDSEVRQAARCGGAGVSHRRAHCRATGRGGTAAAAVGRGGRLQLQAEEPAGRQQGGRKEEQGAERRGAGGGGGQEGRGEERASYLEVADFGVQGLQPSACVLCLLKAKERQRNVKERQPKRLGKAVERQPKRQGKGSGKAAKRQGKAVKIQWKGTSMMTAATCRTLLICR